MMKRSEEITHQYFTFLDKHIQDVISGDVPEFLELNEIAGELAISHKHLTDTIKKETGQHPCSFMMKKLLIRSNKCLWNLTNLWQKLPVFLLMILLISRNFSKK